MNRRQLVETLNSVGKPTESWASSDGTEILVLPYGGRVLGLFAPGDNENFLWTHPALRHTQTAREFYLSEQWHNSGGERTWLAPEVDFFLPNFPDLTLYREQHGLDPGAYAASWKDGTLFWTNRALLTLSRSGQNVELEITKSLLPALNPLRHEASAVDAAVKYAGFTLHTTLQLLNCMRPALVGLWQLTQLPHGGQMLIPTHCRSEPKIYMGEIGRDDLEISDHLICYRMRASGEHKLGIRACAVTGRVGYLYKIGDEASLVVRNFSVNPSGEYIDVPWTETHNLGFAFQACNVNNSLGAFSELEYHVPLTEPPAGGLSCEDQSQLWAFRGPEAAIKAVAQRLLSTQLDCT